MRILILAIIAVVLVARSEIAVAEQTQKHMAIKTAHVEKVLDANPERDGRAYRIEFLLSDGKRVAFQIAPREAEKIADGLSKPAAAGGRKKEVATLVYGMKIDVDSQGRAVILTPRGRSGPLEALAIPTDGAEKFVAVLNAKIAEAKATVTKQPTQPK